MKLLIIDLTPEEIPFTIFSKKLPVVEATLELIVLKLVLLVTPFTFDVSVTPLVVVATETVFSETTDVVAVTPLIVVVSVLPERD